jgi:hypothetical protein
MVACTPQRAAAAAAAVSPHFSPQKQRSHQKHDFLRRTKTGQPVMKVRVDKILEALQAEKGQQGQGRQQQGKQWQRH